MIGGESTIDDLRRRIAELEQERDELAAHVERLRKERDESELQWHVLLSQTCECGDCGWQDNAKREALQSSVARHDLIQQARALEALSSASGGATAISRKSIDNIAADLRRQIKENN